MGRKITVRLLPFFGFLFLTAYLRSASANVVYTDYIRLVNSYLENVYSLSPYLHGDVLTRIPVNYLERIVNVRFFHYSTMFDMVLGAAFLSWNAYLLGRYCEKKRLPLAVTALLMLLMFSLNKWEMLTNGSGWVHFAAFALFFCHYLSLEALLQKNGDRKAARRLLWLPSLTILFFAGPYCAIYALTAVLAELVIVLRFRRDVRQSAARVLAVLLPFGLYLISRSLSVEERHGATTDSIFTVVRAHPLLLPRFFVRSFASEIIGQESAGQLPGFVFTGLGLLVLALYALAFRRAAKLIEKERSLFPLCLIASGFLNHLLVTASRWIFLRENYGMSSRYALQYQVGMLGLLLILFLAARDSGRQGACRLAAVSLLVFCLGNLATTAHEIHMAPYRKENFLAMRTVAKNFEAESDETLVKVLSYHDPVRIRKALSLLQHKNLNVFYEKKE